MDVHAGVTVGAGAEEVAFGVYLLARDDPFDVVAISASVIAGRWCG